MFLVDSHCHLDALNYENYSLDDVIKRSLESQVRHIISVATTLEGYQKLTQLTESYSMISLSCGVHPLNLDDEEFDLDKLRSLSQDTRVVALGETGLDYYYQQDNKKEQQAAFIGHIDVSKSLNKPVIVHTRNARSDTLSIIKNEQCELGVLHCFTEDLDTAKKLLDLGFYISFSGIVTFKNAKDLQAVAKYVPLDRMLIETDSPYLAPVPYRGKENQPSYVSKIAEYLAVLKGVQLDELATITTNNVQDLFNIQLSIN